MTPYYDDGQVTIYHGDCRDVLPAAGPSRRRPAVLLTDPPYGVDYESGSPRREGNARAITGDKDTTLRDWALAWWIQRWLDPALVFGSPRVAKPTGTRGTLIWDKGGALGMGDLSLPWKFDHEEIYVLGGGFVGKRDSGSVLRYPPVQSVGRLHPHEKPVGLMALLLNKCPPGVVLDPFCGVGSSLVAAKSLGRRAIGIEVEERYCEIAAKRCAQGVLDLGGAA